MNTRTLGKSNINIKPLGLGCAAIGGYYTRNGRVASRGAVNDDESIRAIHVALDHDIQLFDVANIYGAGHAERILGKALSNGKRQQAILQVKFGASFDEVSKAQIDYDGILELQWIRQSIEGSLRRLQTDTIDILQFQPANYTLDDIPPVLDLLNEFITEGKIRAYSIGTPDIDKARLFAEAPHCANVITNHNILMDASEMLTLLEEHQVALLAGIPFYLGLLTGKNNSDSTFTDDDLRQNFNLKDERFRLIIAKLDAIKGILQSDGRTVAQGALAWLWARHPLTIPLPGFKNAHQVEDNAQALAFGALRPEQMTAISEILETQS